MEIEILILILLDFGVRRPFGHLSVEIIGDAERSLSAPGLTRRKRLYGAGLGRHLLYLLAPCFNMLKHCLQRHHLAKKIA